MSTVKEEMEKLTLGNAGGNRPLNQAGTRGLMAFIDLMPLMPEKIRKEFAEKTIQYENVEYYDTKSFASGASGSVILFKSDSVISDGVCNIANGKLDADKPAVIVGIMIEYSTAASGFSRTALPATLQADLILKVDGKDLVKVGMQSFNQIEGESNKYFLPIDGKLIPDQKSFSVEIKVAAGGNAGAGQNTFRGTLVGVGVQSK